MKEINPKSGLPIDICGGAIPLDRLAVAKAYYEGTPGMTFTMLAEKTGLPKNSLQKVGLAEKWRKNYIRGEMTAEAHAAADEFRRSLESIGPEITIADVEQATENLVHKISVDLRAELLDRHRSEWKVVRALSLEALKQRDTAPGAAFDRAKLAKITSETIQIVQNGERKAWGLDVGELPAGSVVVIERNAEPT